MNHAVSDLQRDLDRYSGSQLCVGDRWNVEEIFRTNKRPVCCNNKAQYQSIDKYPTSDNNVHCAMNYDTQRKIVLLLPPPHIIITSGQSNLT